MFRITLIHGKFLTISASSALRVSTGKSGMFPSSDRTPGDSSPLMPPLTSLLSEMPDTLLPRDLILSALLMIEVGPKFKGFESGSPSSTVDERCLLFLSPFFSFKLLLLKLPLDPGWAAPVALRSKWGLWAPATEGLILLWDIRFSCLRSSSDPWDEWREFTSPSASCKTKDILLSPGAGGIWDWGWDESAKDIKLWAEFWLKPRLLRAIDHLLLAVMALGSRLALWSTGLEIEVREVLVGRYWWLSRRKVVISNITWVAASLRAKGQSFPFGLTLASFKKSSSSSSCLKSLFLVSSKFVLLTSTALSSMSSSLAPMASAHW